MELYRLELFVIEWQKLTEGTQNVLINILLGVSCSTENLSD